MSDTAKIASHLRRLATAVSNMEDVPDSCMWPSVLDVRTGRYPEGEHVPRRVYRQIGAPRGSSLYWDQPLIAAAWNLGRQPELEDLKIAADGYVTEFLKLCVADNSMFCWGNHQYFDVFERKVIEFHGGYHELRPLTPAWDVFWYRDPVLTEKYIRAMTRRHVYDFASGGFNRHDTGTKNHAFIEAGGVLVEALAWLFSKTGDKELLEQGLRIARFSYSHRGKATGLVVNQPDKQRWDAKVSTTEVGVWAQSLLRAYEYTRIPGFADMAREAVRAYIDYGYDKAAGRYFGQLDVETGAPVFPESEGYWPRYYTNAWSTDQWPNHDYPTALGEACLTIYAATGDAAFAEAAQRLAAAIIREAPAKNSGLWAYAENYGRSLHLLHRAGRELNEPELLAGAAALAATARELLYEEGMFLGYPGDHLYESVDGTGYLCLALLAMETGTEPELFGFGF